MKTRFLSSMGLATTLAVGMVGAQGLTNKSSAVVISQTSGFPTQFLSTTPTDFGDVVLGQPPVAISPTLLKFNSSYGTLNSVTIELIAKAEGTGQVTNNGPSVAAATLRGAAAVSLDLPGTIASPLVANPSVSIFLHGIAPGATSAVTPFSNTVTSTTVYTTAAELSPFIGSGVISGFVSGIGESLVRGSGNFRSTLATRAGAQVTVFYNFTAAPTPVPPGSAVPEPSSTLGALLAALGGIGLAKSLKRKQKITSKYLKK